MVCELDCDEKCQTMEDGEHFFTCRSCGLHLPHGLYDRLNEKINEVDKEIKENPETYKNHTLDLTAFRFYLQQIRGDRPLLEKQECPFDI